MKIKYSLKVFFILTTIVLSISLNAQQKFEKTNNLGLNSPLNSVYSKNYCDKNPELYIEITKSLKKILSKICVDDLEIVIPVRLFINNSGVVKNIQLSDLDNPIVDKSLLNHTEIFNLLSLISETKITKDKLLFSNEIFLEGVILLYITTDYIQILNQ